MLSGSSDFDSGCFWKVRLASSQFSVMRSAKMQDALQDVAAAVKRNQTCSRKCGQSSLPLLSALNHFSKNGWNPLNEEAFPKLFAQSKMVCKVGAISRCIRADTSGILNFYNLNTIEESQHEQRLVKEFATMESPDFVRGRAGWSPGKSMRVFQWRAIGSQLHAESHLKLSAASV